MMVKELLLHEVMSFFFFFFNLFELTASIAVPGMFNHSLFSGETFGSVSARYVRNLIVA